MAAPRRRRAPSGDGFTLAQDVAERRLALGLTQEEVSALAGVSRTSLQALESGQTSIRMASALAVADALGCSVVLMSKAEARSRHRTS